MPSLFRSLSARFRRNTKDVDSNVPKVDPRKQVCCKVLLLDGTDLNIVVPRKALGEEVYEQVFYTLDLEERDYFGLQYTDHYHVQHWLDPLKRVSKQVPIGPPFTFRFKVKFYSSEPNNLREELTRYQFFLQVKQDILNGRLPCTKEVAIELAAYALQSELGDYNPIDHSPLFISEFRFHPQQDEQMELDIVERFRQCKGQSPAQAELNFLNKAKWLEMFGVDMHVVEGKDGNHYSLGLTPTGMLVFDGNQKIGLFFWEKIQKLDFRNRKITLVVEEDSDTANSQVQLHTFVFNLTSTKACKHLWKCAIEHHSFFRLKFRTDPKQRGTQLFRLGSTFKYRGRTEYETVHKDVGRLSRRTSTNFERRPSQRYGARQSHANREQMRNERRQEARDAIRSQATSVFRQNAPHQGYTNGPTNQSINNLNQSIPVPSGIPVMNPTTKIAAAEARLDNLIFNSATNSPLRQSPESSSSRPHSGGSSSIGLNASSPSQSHVTMIPVKTADQNVSPSSSDIRLSEEMKGKDTKIPKYVVAPMQKSLLSDNSSPCLIPSQQPLPSRIPPPKQSGIKPPSNRQPLKQMVVEPSVPSSISQSRIPRMQSGGVRPTEFGGSVTYIPIMRTGPSTQSRVITDL